MTARDRFHKGQRVRLSPEGRDWGINPKHPDRMGTVAGFSKDPDLVLILEDGLKNPRRYHMSFWSAARSASVTAAPGRRGRAALLATRSRYEAALREIGSSENGGVWRGDTWWPTDAIAREALAAAPEGTP
jgi:hypothetical protein